VQGIAKRLAFYAIEAATHEWGQHYRDIIKFPKGLGPSGWPSVSSKVTRSVYYDDIAVIVVYLHRSTDADLNAKSKSYINYSEFKFQSVFSEFDDGCGETKKNNYA
jgi:hypothetical protein